MDTTPPVALCPPAVRMVAVAVHVCRDSFISDTEWWTRAEFAPVVAISARQTVDENGDFQDLDYRAVVVDPDYGGLTDAAYLSSYGHRIVAAPWPAEEDEERLAYIVTELEDEVIGKAKPKGARRPKPSFARQPAEAIR